VSAIHVNDRGCGVLAGFFVLDHVGGVDRGEHIEGRLI
jgi:hypothetical protein